MAATARGNSAVGSTFIAAGSPLTIAFNGNVVSGNRLYVVRRSRTGPLANLLISDNLNGGQTWSVIAQVGGTSLGFTIYRAVANASGACTVSLDISTGSTLDTAVVFEVQGAGVGTPEYVIATNDNSDNDTNSASANLGARSNADDLLIGAVGTSNVGAGMTFTPNNGFTTLQQRTADEQIWVGTRATSDTSDIDLSVSMSAVVFWRAIEIAIASGGPAAQSVTGATCGSTFAASAPTVAPGPVAVSGVTVTSTFAPNAPSVVYAITTVALSSTFVVNAPSARQEAGPALIASFVRRRRQRVGRRITKRIVRKKISATIIYPRSEIGAAFLASTFVANAPSVAVGSVGITGATVASTFGASAPSLAQDAISVVLPTVTSTFAASPPLVTPDALLVAVATATSTFAASAPSVSTGTVNLTSVTAPSTFVARAPSLTGGSSPVRMTRILTSSVSMMQFSVGGTPTESSFEAGVVLWSKPVLANKTSWLFAQVVDEQGAGFRPEAMTVTLYEKYSQLPINARNASDILSSVDAEGRVELELTPLDNALLVPTNPRQIEVHRALLEWEWNGGSRKGAVSIEYVLQEAAYA